MVLLNVAKNLNIHRVCIPSWNSLGGRDAFTGNRRLLQNPEHTFFLSGISARLVAFFFPSQVLRCDPGRIALAFSPGTIISLSLAGYSIKYIWEVPSTLYSHIYTVFPGAANYLKYTGAYPDTIISTSGRFSLIAHDVLSDSSSKPKPLTRSSRVIVWSPSNFDVHQMMDDNHYRQYLLKIASWISTLESTKCLISFHPRSNKDVIMETLCEYPFEFVTDKSIIEILSMRPTALS